MSDARPDHRLERLSFFSDAVFAIAITLLIIEIHVPLVEHPTDRAFLIAIAHLIPSFVGFAVSFFVIGAFWAGHHRTFACARAWDQRVLFPNLLLLFAVAAMPFFTAFSSSYSMYRVPVALYCAWLTLTAFFNVRLQRMLTSQPLVVPELSQDEIGALRRRGVAVLLGGMSAFIVALIVPYIALTTLLTIPLWRWLLNALATRRSRG